MDMLNMCLVCMKFPGTVPVFDEYGREENIGGMIKDFLGVTVQESDGPPEHICEKCYATLHGVNDLKECARRSSQKLALLQLFESDDSAEAETDDSTEVGTDDSIEVGTDDSIEVGTDDSIEVETDDSIEAESDDSAEAESDCRAEAESDCRAEAETDDRAEAELESPNEPASKPAPWKPHVDDDILYERVTTSCDLKEFKKHIPFVKLERVDDPEWDVKWPQFPESQLSAQQHFTLCGLDIFGH